MFPSLTTSNDSEIVSSPNSSSTSSSPFSHLPTTNKTMEEVWKEINIPSLPNTPLPHTNHYINLNNHHIIHHPTPSSNLRGTTILQDFFTGRDTTPPLPSRNLSHNNHVDAPGTALQLFEPQHQYNNALPSFPTFDALASNALMTSFGCGDGGGVAKKSAFDEPEDNENATVDRRRKRMIKNRESAARSRARKQAYITELELEVAHLAEENARLRKQHQQLLEAPPTQMPKKHGLYRTSTAPF